MKIRIAAVLPLILLSFTVWGQYDVTVSNSSYTELSGATDLAYNTTDDGYYYQTNFIFPVFKTRLANFNQNIPHNSNGAFMSSNGILAIYDAPGYINTIVFQCLYDHDSFKTAGGITKASVKMEGPTGNRILKFQWKNIVFGNDVNQRINFQVWFHEADSSISYHYGPNSIIQQLDQTYCGIVVFNSTFTTVLNECNVEGSPSSPAVYDTFTTAALPTLDTLPRNGLVYTFKPKYSNSSNVHHVATEKFDIYPNPATNEFVVSRKQSVSVPMTVNLIDVTGKILRTSTLGINQVFLKFNVQDIASGIYFVDVSANNIHTFYPVQVLH